MYWIVFSVIYDESLYSRKCNGSFSNTYIGKTISYVICIIGLLRLLYNNWSNRCQLDNHGIPTGRTRKACSCLLCDACGHKETVDDTFDEPYK